MNANYILCVYNVMHEQQWPSCLPAAAISSKYKCQLLAHSNIPIPRKLYLSCGGVNIRFKKSLHSLEYTLFGELNSLHSITNKSQWVCLIICVQNYTKVINVNTQKSNIKRKISRRRFVLTHAVGSPRVAWGNHGRHATRRRASWGWAGHHTSRKRLAWSHRSCSVESINWNMEQTWMILKEK